MDLMQFQIIRELLLEIRDRLPEREPDLRFQDLETVMAYHRAKFEEALGMRQEVIEEMQPPLS